MWSGAARSLAALGVVLCLGGCAATPSPSIQVRPRPAPSPSYSGLAANTFLVQAGNLFGVLPARGAKISCSAGGRGVRVSGEVQGESVVIALSHLQPGQSLLGPPLGEGFSDSVTMTVGAPGSASPAEYEAGFQDGSYQGAGTLRVGRSGRTGTVAIQFGPPVGQEPSAQSSGGTTIFAANSGSVEGRWSCP